MCLQLTSSGVVSLDYDWVLWHASDNEKRLICKARPEAIASKFGTVALTNLASIRSVMEREFRTKYEQDGDLYEIVEIQLISQ